MVSTRALTEQRGLSGNSCDSHSRGLRFVSLPGKRHSLMMKICGVPKPLQANTVLVHKIKPRPIKSKELKLAYGLVTISQLSSRDQMLAEFPVPSKHSPCGT